MQSALKASSKPDLAVDRRRWRWRAVIYQIYPRSYQDSNVDGIGDLRGIIGRLPYIAALGVETPSGYRRSSSRDEGFRLRRVRLLRRRSDVRHAGRFRCADRRGAQAGLEGDDRRGCCRTPPTIIRVQGKPGRAAPTRRRLVCLGGRQAGRHAANNWLSIFGGSAWQWDTSRQQYYLHNFLRSSPTSTSTTSSPGRAARRRTRFWLERGV